VNVLRTTQFICRIRSIDIVYFREIASLSSLREIRVIARRACVIADLIRNQ